MLDGAGLYEIVNNYTGSQYLSPSSISLWRGFMHGAKNVVGFLLHTPSQFVSDCTWESIWRWKHYLMLIAVNRLFIFPPLNYLTTFWGNLHFVAPNIQWQQTSYFNLIWHVGTCIWKRVEVICDLYTHSLMMSFVLLFLCDRKYKTVILYHFCICFVAVSHFLLLVFYQSWKLLFHLMLPWTYSCPSGFP